MHSVADMTFSAASALFYALLSIGFFHAYRKVNVLMATKRTVRFVKWLIKVVISYAVFIGTGWLLGRIPAEKIGLSEDMFFDLRMFSCCLAPFISL